MPGLLRSPVKKATKGAGKRWIRRVRQSIPDRTVNADCRCRNAYGEIDANADEVVLDVRDLTLKGQIGRTLEQMEVLAPGQKLRHVNSIIPWPLFAMLETRGYRYRMVGREKGNINVLVWPISDQ
ncbi:MAG TPA: DUF2249 domain-containing protein [Longimicrobiaceae bacterium]|nr:DUF2249 domain-containing protein [Longimicrobiaceae bacterium]